MKRLALALVLALLAGPALARPPVWIVRDKDSTLVLFGSVHLLPPDLDWKPQALTDALGKADDLWFELPIDPIAEAEAARLAGEKGMLPLSDTLWNHLSPAQADRLKKIAASLSISPSSLERMRPWLVEVTLAVIMDTRSGASVDNGVEQQLQNSTPATVRRRAFESPGEQIEILSGAAMSDQVASLEQALGDIETQPELYQQVVKDWMTADVAAIEARALTPMLAAAPAIYERLLTARNKRWLKVIERRMAGSGETVVVVGVGHLVGAGGLPAMLRARGYTVEGP